MNPLDRLANLEHAPPANVPPRSQIQFSPYRVFSREEWAKRVARWKDSGLTAKEFATELGINPRSLTFWKWQLGKGSERSAASSAVTVKSDKESTTRTLPLIELAQPSAPARFELELGGGRRVTIPATFDADALRRLLAVLDPAS